MTTRRTPTIILQRLRKSAGLCPACKEPMISLGYNLDGEVAGYKCGSFWTFSANDVMPGKVTCNVSCTRVEPKQ